MAARMNNVADRNAMELLAVAWDKVAKGLEHGRKGEKEPADV
jgi:hypothetical protein